MSRDSARDPRSIEERLRAAFAAQAYQVDPGRLAAQVPPATAPGRRSHRPFPRRGGLAPLVAAACVLALAAGIVVAVSTGGSNARTGQHAPAGSSPPLPVTSASRFPSSSAVTSAPLPTSAMLGPGEVGGRSDVPWSLVGDGWTVTVWARTPLAPGQTLSRPIEQTVFLVDPVGGRYEITSFKAPQLAVADISGDHARALLSDYDTAREVNLQTGAVATLALPFPGDVRYTKPRGLAVVVLGAQEVRRIGLDGSTQHTYLKTTSVGLSPALTALYSPDGSTVVFGTSTGLLVEGNDGSNPHTVSPPNTSYCWAPRWWAPNVVLASCNVDGLPGLQLWKVPVDGAAPAALTPVPRDGLGNTEAWPVNAGTFVAGGVGCGGGFVPRMLDADGSTRDLSISVPGQDHGDAPELSGVTADSVFVRVNVGCQLAVKAELVRYDPAGGTATVLFGGTAGGGAVVGAKTISSLG